MPGVNANGQEGYGGSRRSPQTKEDCKRTGRTRSVESSTAVPRVEKAWVSVDFNPETRAKAFPCTCG